MGPSAEPWHVPPPPPRSCLSPRCRPLPPPHVPARVLVPTKGNDGDTQTPPPAPGRGPHHHEWGEELASVRPPAPEPFDSAGVGPRGSAVWGFGNAVRQVQVCKVRACVRERCATLGPPRDRVRRGRHFFVLFCRFTVFVSICCATAYGGASLKHEPSGMLARFLRVSPFVCSEAE